MPVTGANKKDKMVLAKLPYIYYLLRFWKNNQNKMRASIDFGSKLNKITPIYVLKLGLWVCQTYIGTQKIDGSTFKIFEIILASFQLENKLKMAKFF